MSEIVNPKSFQERMYEKIREQLGEMMTEAELKTMVEAAVQKAFFEKRTVNGSYGRVEVEESEFITLIKNQMSAQVQKVMKEYLEEHQDKFFEAIDECIAKGFFGLVQQHIQNQMHMPLQMFADQLRSRGIMV